MSKIKKIASLIRSPYARKAYLKTRTAVAVEHLEMLRFVRPRTVIDVGANNGRFALAAIQVGVSKVYSFEPLPSEAEIFRQNLGSSSKVELFEFALADTSGRATLHVADRADSSSLLQIGAGQNQAYNVSESRTITVDVRRLDQVVGTCISSDRVLLKIDVQGAEDTVLSGSTGVLEKIEFIYTEASFVELYSGQILAHELIEFLSRLGYVLRGAYNLSHTDAFGPTQADLLFKRKP